MVKEDDPNITFPKGEETILEQACLILDKRRTHYFSKHFKYSKRLQLKDNE